jgi:integrase
VKGENRVSRITPAVIRRYYGKLAQGSPYYVYEEAIRGLVLRVHRSKVQIGARIGRSAFVPLADLQREMTEREVDDLRERARGVIFERSGMRQEEKSPAPTLAQAAELHLSSWAAGRENRSPRTEEGYRSLWRLHIIPFQAPGMQQPLGEMPVDRITPRTADAVRLSMPAVVAARDAHARRGGEVVTNRVLQQLAACFSYLLRMQIVSANPFAEEIVRRYEEAPGGYAFPVDELGRIGAALKELEQRAARPGAPLALRSIYGIWLLFLTGARPAELTEAYLERRFVPAGSSAPYAMLDDQYPRLYVQRAKGDRRGQKRMPGRFIWLGARPAGLIRSVPRVPGDEFILPGDIPGDHIQRLNSAWKVVLREAKVPHVPLKSTRHTFRSWAAEAGIPPEHVQQLMGHAGLTITDTVYLHGIAPSLLASAERASEFIADRMAGKPWKPGAAWEQRQEGDGVVTPFRRPAS